MKSNKNIILQPVGKSQLFKRRTSSKDNLTNDDESERDKTKMTIKKGISVRFQEDVENSKNGTDNKEKLYQLKSDKR